MAAAGVPEAAPDVPTAVFRILAVCTANICRSPMVEYLLRSSLAASADRLDGVRFEVSSAGVRGWDGSPMDPPAAEELRRLGGDPSRFVARSFGAALGERADLILTATTDHRSLVLQEVPQALRRTFTLLEFARLVSAVDGSTAGEGPGAAGERSCRQPRCGASRRRTTSEIRTASHPRCTDEPRTSWRARRARSPVP